MVMECVGTLLYTFIASGAVVATANVAFQPQVASPATLTTIALAAGWGYTAVLYMMQTMTRNAVGYCNPAITVAVWLFGSKRVSDYHRRIPLREGARLCRAVCGPASFPAFPHSSIRNANLLRLLPPDPPLPHPPQ